MNKLNSKLMFVASLLLVVLFIVGCSSNGANQSDKESTNNNGDKSSNEEKSSDVEQEIIFGTTGEAIGLSPIATWDGQSGYVNSQLYEPLFERDAETREIVPLLAESYENPDDLTWVIKLKEGIKFHDGTPFNAEAVKYSYETQADPEKASPSGHLLAFIDKVEVVDEYTVKLITKEPTPNTLPVIANRATSIVSPTADQNQDLLQEPVGTGPFKFESWTHGDRIVMVRNEEYWGEPAPLEKATYITVPDTSTAVSMLETGAVDFLQGIDPELLPRVEAMKDVEILKQEGGTVYFVSFNMSKAPMNELDFRKAVAMGIDKDSYLNSIGGIGYKSNGLFGPAVLDYNPSIEEHGYSYDPEAAKKIIKEKGYDKHELTLYSSDRGGFKQLAEVAQAELTELGLNVTIEMLEWSTYLENASAGKHDMHVGSTSNSVTGLETMYGYFHSNNIGGNNRTLTDVPEFDKIIDEARYTLDDDARYALIDEAHEMIIDDAYIVPVYHGYDMLPHNSSVKGLILPPFLIHKAYKE